MFSVKNTVLFTLFAANLIDQPAPVVKIYQGFVSGKVNSDGSIHEYVGIPYATTRGRFQAPLPGPSWDGVFKAVDEHYQCPQVMGVVIGTEDCLRINVYVPAHVTRPLPVMVYIHGGAFIMGSGGKMIYGPDLLLKHDVILVTLNYRLGALGFLCLGIEEAPGNAGLKDQIAALRWVKNNIAAFSGDPDNVTIFGHSAGAASTALLVISDATEGLFNRAIVQSGSSISFWTSKDGIEIASSVAKILGYNTNDPKELYDIFSTVPLKDLIMASTGKPLLHLIRNNMMYSPCIEKEFASIEPVYTKLPYDMIKDKPKNISVIYGFTDREGLFLLGEETEESLKEINKVIYDFSDFKFSSKEEAEIETKKIRAHYLGDREINNETVANVMQFLGDVYFDVPMVEESELMVRKVNAPIYNYYFKYAGGRNFVKDMYFKNESGASHGDDILYIFHGFIYPYRIKERDQKIIDWMTKMWTNFARTGDPTPSSDKYLPVKWEPSRKENLKFLYIDESLEMGSVPNPERYKPWRTLYQKYRKFY